MKKSDVISALFYNSIPSQPAKDQGYAFAPTNIALCKYWGKRDTELNLPVTSSLSIALPGKGAATTLRCHDGANDVVVLNGDTIANDSPFVLRLQKFLHLFRPKHEWSLHVDIKMNIPVAAGLASSACGFAALTEALNDLFGWGLAKQELSILARLGSGSASRSLWNGFVEWHAGERTDGMDSFAEPLPYIWEALCVGIVPISHQQKSLSSRDAMLRTVNTSMLYKQWPQQVARDMATIKQGLENKDFSMLAAAAETNALAMHATMLSSWPPVSYFLPETVAAMHKVWALRASGVEVYFTQDAGPNLKLLYLKSDEQKIHEAFPEMGTVHVFTQI